MPFFVYWQCSPRRECPWQGKGTKRVQRIQEWIGRSRDKYNVEKTFTLVMPTKRLIKPNRLLALLTVMLIWLSHERSFDIATPRSLKLFTSFKGLSNIYYCVMDLSRVWVMRIDSHLSALSRNCHLCAHSIRLERSIYKSWGSSIGSTIWR